MRGAWIFLGRAPDPWTRVYQPADSEAVARTLAFADYAVAQSTTS